MRAMLTTSVAMALLVGPGGATAATRSGQFTVSVIVEASCTISVAPVLASLRSPADAGARVCQPARGPARGIQPPPPVVTLSRDSVAGRPVLIVAF